MRLGRLLAVGLTFVAIGVTSTAEATPSMRHATTGTALGLAAGHSHACVVTSTRGLVCWGSDSYGALGPACTYRHCRPVTVPSLAGVTAVANGNGHSCALIQTGAVACWGSNELGQLGTGCSRDSCPQPVGVPGFGPASAVAAGDGFSCAVTSAGGVECWGIDGNGQLGDGGRCGTPCPEPVQVEGLSSHVAAVSAGGYHACALIDEGAVKCWGYNAEGQIGDGRACGYLACRPSQVVGLTSGVAAIAAGGAHTCALKTSGGVTCWGYSAYGQLGGGGKSCEWSSCLLPGDVPTLTGGVASISAGEVHTCAVTTSGRVKCWGLDSYGGVSGNPETCPQQECAAPTDANGVEAGVAAVQAGSYYSCALLPGGSVKCWGWNASEQLGDGTMTSRIGAVYVAGFGAEYCFVPFVEQMGRPAALRALAAAGCAARVRLVYSALFRKGRVIEQTPYATTRLQLGGRVHLVVSKGKKPKTHHSRRS